MLLVVGVSFAPRLTGRLTTSDNVTARGRTGATLQSDSFRRWAIACACEAQPEAVLSSQEATMSLPEISNLVLRFPS